MTREAPFLAMLSASSPRHADWIKVFGDGRVPLKAPVSFQAELPIGVVEVYLVDLDALPADVLERLVAHLAERESAALDEVHAALAAQGLPILAEDVTVAIDMRYLV